MLNTNINNRSFSQAFKDAVASDNVLYTMQIVKGERTAREDIGGTIKSATLTFGAGSDFGGEYEDIQVGAIYSSSLEADIYDLPTLPIGEEIEIQVGVDIGGEYEYAAVALMRVTSSKSNNGFTTIKAIGNLGFQLDEELGLAAGSYTGSRILNEVINRLDYVNMYMKSSVLNTYLNSQMQILGTETIREALESVAKKVGAFIYDFPLSTSISGEPCRQPMLYVKSFKDSSTVNVQNKVTNASDVAESYTVTGLKIIGETDTWTFGEGKTLTIEDRTATAETAAMTWESLGGLSVLPGTIECAAIDPRVVLGDKVTFTRKINNLMTVQNMQVIGVSVKYDGGYFGTYSSNCLPQVASEAYQSPLRKQVEIATLAAEQAAAAAQATNQHFWNNTTGAWVTDEEKDDYLLAQDENFPDWQPDKDEPNYKPWFAVLLNSLGQLFKSGKYILSSFSNAAIAFYDGLWDGTGTGEDHVVAAFGTTGYQIGKNGQTRQIGDYHSLQMIDKNNNAYVQFKDLRDESGNFVYTENFYGDGTTRDFTVPYPINIVDVIKVNGRTTTAYAITTDSSGRGVIRFNTAPASGAEIVATVGTNWDLAKTYVLGIPGDEVPGALSFNTGSGNNTIGMYSAAFGSGNTASGKNSIAEGNITTASGEYSHSEGTNTTASGQDSHSFGQNTTASADQSIAMGLGCTTSGSYSLAGGNGSQTVTANGALSFGYQCNANGNYGIALGNKADAYTNCVALGNNVSCLGMSNKFLMGQYLNATTSSLAILGKYNDTTEGGLFVIGNGTSSARSNVMTLQTGGVLLLKSSTINRDAANPSSRQAGSRVMFTDVDKEDIGAIQTYRETDGRITVALIAANSVSGTTKSNYISVHIAKNGNTSYSVYNPAAFREAIELGDTEKTTTIANIISESSAVSITGASYSVWGKIACCSVTFTPKESWAANAQVQVGTVVSGKRPSTQVGGGASGITAGISTVGNVYARNNTGAARTASTTVGFVYLIP